jgi:hypothetical protein
VADRVDEVADRLYGMPLEEFTPERDAAAKALRRDDRDAAAEVARLPKPGAGPWAVNVLARRRPELRDELLEAGEQLRAAQDAAIAGRGADELRAATTRERAAVDALLDAAAKLRPGGRKLSAQAVDRLRRTLHAAAGDDEVRAALAAGRLVGDAEGGGAWPFGLGAPEEDARDEPAAEPRRAGRKKPAAKKPAAKKPAAKQKPAPKARRDEREAQRAAKREAAERDAAERRKAEREAAARRLELETELAGARRGRTRRERELATAQRDADRAAERLDQAREAAEQARHAVARIEEQLD